MKITLLNVTDIPESDLRSWLEVLPNERKKRCKTIKKTTAQRCCIAADRLARQSVAEHLRKPTEAVQICYTAEGKPYVRGNPCYFSVSHSGVLVICAVSDRPIGVDAEEIRPINGEIANKICTAEELAYLESIKIEEERNRWLLQIWTKKEAIFKIEGKLPRRDREVNTLSPDGVDLQTQEFENYFISVAEKQIIPEYCW